MKLVYKFKEIKIQDLSESHFNQLLQIFIESSEDYNYPLPRSSDEAVKKSMLDKGDFETKMTRYIAISPETDEVHAYCNLINNTGNHNRSFGRGILITLKSKRNLGIGKDLLSFAMSRLPGEVKTLSFSVRNDGTKRDQKPDSKFDLYLQRIGGKFSLSDRRSGSNITKFDKNEVKFKAYELVNQAKNKGFDLYFVDGYKFKDQSNFNYPEYLKALEGIWNDMPRDDSAEEDWEITQELHQDFYTRGKERNQHPWTFVAVQNETKEVAGLTETWLLRNRSDVVWQDDTGVIKKYRGNGLGLMLKYQMLEKLLFEKETKDVKWWTTHNSHSNEHMLAINNILKYEEIGTFNYYEFEIEKLKKYLKGI